MGGLIQVVVGVVNQPNTAPITFTLKIYKWWLADNKHGLLLKKQVIYTPFTVDATLHTLQQRDQIKQYPFYTRYYSDVAAPFRMAFKMPTSLTVPLSYLDLTPTFMILDEFDAITATGTNQIF